MTSFNLYSFRENIENGDIKYVKSLLKEDTVFDVRLSSDATNIASEFGQLEILKLFLSDNRIKIMRTELIKAAENRHLNIVKYLFDNQEYMTYLTNPENSKYYTVRQVFRDIWEAAARGGNVIIGKLVMSKMQSQKITPNNVIDIAASYGNYEFVVFLLGFKNQDPRQGSLEPAIIVATLHIELDEGDHHVDNIGVTKLLLNDIRVDPSVEGNDDMVYDMKRNDAVLTALGKSERDPKFNQIVDLLLSDDKLTDENLPDKLLIIRLNLLKNKKWSLKRFDLQSDENIINFFESFSYRKFPKELQIDENFMNDDIWMLRYKLLLILKNNDKLNTNDAIAISNETFEKYFLMTDKDLIELLNDKNIKKLEYFSHTAASLLLTYLNNNEKYLIELLLDMVPIYVGNQIKKFINIIQ